MIVLESQKEKEKGGFWSKNRRKIEMRNEGENEENQF